MVAMKKKDLKISNAKGLLIFLVVLGHLMEIYKDDYKETFVFIYGFHMPLFIMISGYLAKRMRLSKIVNMILLYFVFQTFFNWVLYLTGDYEHLQFTYGEPHFHLWYIISLGVWYGIAYIINHCKLTHAGKWIVFILLFTIGFISRWYTDDVENMVSVYYENFSSYTLSFQRTLSFMPFFFAGFFLTTDHMKKIYNSLTNIKILMTLLFVTLFVTFLYLQDSHGIESLFRGSYGKDRILEDDQGFFVYVLKTSFHYILAFWLSYLMMNMITDKESVMTKWGDRSLPIFLFHPIFVFIIRQTEYMDHWSSDTKFVGFFIMAIIVTSILRSYPFVRMTSFMCNPYRTMQSLFKKS